MRSLPCASSSCIRLTDAPNLCPPGHPVTLVVDGYNIIHAWPQLKDAMDESLELARDALVARLATYHQVTGADVTVVFDAHFTQSRRSTELVHDGVKIMFTRAGNSADHAIERLAYAASRAGQPLVVATSDRFHRDMVRGMGMAVIDARELEYQVEDAERTLRRRLERDYS
jgi:predicted RNA-binding protein with PIN domain